MDNNGFWPAFFGFLTILIGQVVTYWKTRKVEQIAINHTKSIQNIDNKSVENAAAIEENTSLTLEIAKHQERAKIDLAAETKSVAKELAGTVRSVAERLAQTLKETTNESHKQINGRMDQLLQASFDQGKLAAIEEQKTN